MLKEYIKKLETPRILAIDKVHLHGEYRGVICNGEQNTLIISECLEPGSFFYFFQRIFHTPDQ
ncbi:hypothetical protein DXT63_04705 [Thermoanaerobacteraceae bacterium SP2]|nr:hypothetical protein DXT63_04705 [Thermoanaerobacteraceae bacterium SP2]